MGKENKLPKPIIPSFHYSNFFVGLLQIEWVKIRLKLTNSPLF
jgi:hypothetical protein